MKDNNFDELLAQFDAHMAKFFSKRRKANELLLNIQTEVRRRQLQINQNKPKIEVK